VIYDELQTVRLVLTPQLYPNPDTWFFNAIGLDKISLTFNLFLLDGTEIDMDVLPCGKFEKYINTDKTEDIWYS